MKLTKNFTLEEFEHSNSAEKYNIDNHIPQEYMYNVNCLAELLQIIRNAWGAPITINSGYRCDKLNKLVGGVKTSQHTTASAADITVGSKEKNKDLFSLIVLMAKQNKIEFRQLIDEHNFSWIHISINADGYTYKNNQVLEIR